MIGVVIVGAGRGGTKLLQALLFHPAVRVLQVIDPDLDAAGIHLAHVHGIPVATDHRQLEAAFLSNNAPDVVLEATGRGDVQADLQRFSAGRAVIVSGAALRFLMLFLDEKLSLVQKLEERQRELALILDSAHDGLVGINREGKIRLFNAAAAKLTGVPPSQALGRLVDDVIPNSRLPETLVTRQSELNQEQKLPGLEIVTNRVPFFDEAGDVIGAIAVFRDVTELHQLARDVTDLREVQTLLQAVIQSTQDAISVVDKEGRGLLINPAYTRLTGYTPDQVIGKPADVDIAEGDSMHMRVLATRQPVKNVPMKVGPARREVIVNVAPIMVNGELRGSVGVIHDISEIKRLTEELDSARRLIRTLDTKYTFKDIVGTSPTMVVAIEQAKRAASTPATVLLRGESGTGKELFAHAIHHESERRHRPFVRVNCAALSETLLESELFGYEDGAFTGAKRGGKRGLFEEASGGSLFLDEIGDMTLATQAKLLRALQEREIVRVGGTIAVSVDVRVIAATHVNLEQAVVSGSFREDLYYRLNVLPIVIPPLRYRKQDIPLLVKGIILRHNQDYGRRVEGVNKRALDVLSEYHWPGNVRELENTIGRAMIVMNYHETTLDVSHLPTLGSSPGLTQAFTGSSGQHTQFGTLHDVVRRAERAAIDHVLLQTAGNKTEAARRLGISLRTLYYKMEQLGMSQ